MVSPSWELGYCYKLLLDSCGEVSCEDGKLLGKSPEELYKWIEENLWILNIHLISLKKTLSII